MQLRSVALLCISLAVAISPAYAQGQNDAARAAPSGQANGDNGPLHTVSGEGRVLVEGVRQERLFGIDFHGDQGIVVGAFGQVMISEDGGASWEIEQAPTNRALLGVALYEEGAIVVGQQGLVLLRDPEGEWQEVAVETSERLLNVAVNRHGQAIIVGAFGTVLRSSDGGRNWQNAAPQWLELAEAANVPLDETGASAEPSMYSAKVFDDGVVLIAGELSFVLRSEDGGEHWEFANFAEALAEGVDAVAATAPTINDLHVRADGTGFAAGQAGAIFKTTDFGRSWDRKETPLEGVNLLAVASREAGAVIAVGMRSAVFSNDDGESWEPLQALDLDINWYSAIRVAPGATQMLAVGHSGRIIGLQ